MIRLNIPYLDQHELDEIATVLSTGYLTQGPKVAEFEQLVRQYVGSQFAFATSSCTTALHLALVALDVGPGDEVLVPDFTFPATANVVVQQGARPVLVDIELDTFTIDTTDLAAKITPQTKAIIPVHTFGCSADMDPILEIGQAHQIPIIEDAACAIGARYKNRFCGNLATMGCFSFHPRKVITTGEGGMILTNDPGLAERIQLLRSHGGARQDFWYSYEEAGFNYRLSDVLGAIGVAQMAKLPELIERKRALATLLRDRLRDLPEVRPPQEPTWGGHIYQSFVILLDERLNQLQLVKDMRALGIETTLGTYALHDQPYYRKLFGQTASRLINSHIAYTRTLTLPLYPQIKEVEIDLIVEGLKRAIDFQLKN